MRGLPRGRRGPHRFKLVPAVASAVVAPDALAHAVVTTLGAARLFGAGRIVQIGAPDLHQAAVVPATPRCEHRRVDDRFRTEVVVDEVQLNRFADYTIDYDRGTLVFKQPVFSQDEAFNPIFIEVEYEVAPQAADEEIVAGLRAAYRLDAQDSEVALIHVDDGTTGQGGTMTGVDVTWQLDPRHKLTVEAARTDTDEADTARAYLVELERTAENLAGRVYFREQEDGYGLGHQASIEQGTRKAGVEGEYRIAEHTLVSAQLFRQQVLADGTRRLVLNAQTEHRRWGGQMTAGLRGVEEEGAAGDARTAQATLGATRSFLGSRLVLRGDAEVDLLDDDVADYPTRAILGAEYRLAPTREAFAYWLCTRPCAHRASSKPGAINNR